MDGPTPEHSDSESGDSWTLLEHNPLHGDDAPNFAEHPSESIANNHEKDEDTDGISIISDSEPDSPSPCQLKEHYMSDENTPTQHEICQSFLVTPPQPHIEDYPESVTDENDFLGVDNMKHKTYVHRRNKRLSTVLNIIVLGSVITAAGVAIGHMWGAKTDCSFNTTPAVNKILSNLYKLQEENAYLRSKLKEITALSNYQINVQKAASKQNRCRKMFEESLNNDNINRLTKCLDDKLDKPDKLLNSRLIEPAHEKEFIADIDKLKNVYLQNKSWLDEEINQRLKQEEESLKKLKNKPISRLHKINEEKHLNKQQNNLNEGEVSEQFCQFQLPDESINEVKDGIDKITSYADALKSTDKVKWTHNKNHKGKNKIHKLENKGINKNKKIKDYGTTSDSAIEEEFKRQNRDTGRKYRPEKIKRDHKKSYKKQKRRNKYEQWEMKGGIMKDYDEVSFASSRDTESVSKNENVKYDIEQNMEHHKSNTKFLKNADAIDTKGITESIDVNNKNFNGDVDETSWFEKRATLRTEAREKLEKELFGRNPSTAGWYFRRMHKREQCRAKGDNTTYRKLLKRNMNFKMKH